MKQWKTRNGQLIDIDKLPDAHLDNIIKMLRRNGFKTPSEAADMLVGPPPQGEMAYDAWAWELDNIRVSVELPYLIEEQLKRWPKYVIHAYAKPVWINEYDSKGKGVQIQVATGQRYELSEPSGWKEASKFLAAGYWKQISKDEAEALIRKSS